MQPLLDSDLARFNMVEQQIRPWDVLNQDVLNLFMEIPREDFVPDAYRMMSFADIQIPLAKGQQMMEPKQEARLLQALDIQPTDHILEIGTGSAYLTACLAKLGGMVHSIDRYASFIRTAKAKLAALKLNNVRLEIGDGMSFEDPEARYDAIALTGSLPQLDTCFQEHLHIGGRLFAIVGSAPIMEALLITRDGEQQWTQTSLFETQIAPLITAPKPKAFVF